MITDENRKLDREILAALIKLGFEINPEGRSAYAEFSVIAGDYDNPDFHLQIVTDNGGRISDRRVTREHLLSFAKAVEHECDWIVGGAE